MSELRKKQEVDSVKENSISVPDYNAVNEKGSGPGTLNTPALNTGGRDAIALRAPGIPGSSSALDLIKKKLHESGAQVTSFPTSASSGSALLEVNGSKTVEPTAKGFQGEGSKDKLGDADGDGKISDTSSDSEDEDTGPTKEECIAQFKVSFFSPIFAWMINTEYWTYMWVRNYNYKDHIVMRHIGSPESWSRIG